MKTFLQSSLILMLLVLCFSANGQTPTWSGNVAKIIYGNCTSCHRTGGIAPFTLETYDEVSAMAGWIEQSIVQKKMPPWPPDENYKELAHQRVLPATDVTTFQQWVAAGMPSGNLNLAPPLPSFPNGTQLGVPNVSLTIPTFTVPNNNDYYKNFVLNVGNATATNATAIEVIPGNPAIVHHVLVFQDSTNNPINTGGGGGGTGSAASQLIYSWVPGASPYYTPVGTGIRLAPNTRIILQIHYAPGSNGMNDATVVNLKTSIGALRKITINPLLNHSNLTNGPLAIGANQIKTFNAEFTLPIKATFLYTFPHMHLLGKNFRVWANAPITNDTTRFVWIPEWDFHWQDNFIFPNTVVLNVGHKLKSQATYDNTSSNLNNPSSPPINVTAGEGTADEMHLVFLAYMPYQAGDENIIVDKRIFVKGATTFCDGHTVRLETIKGVGYTYQWYRNGTLISGATNYFYEASLSGSYTVSITLGPNNATSDPVNVVVNSLPSAVITNPGNTVIPNGGIITLNGNTGAGLQYQWYLNGSLIQGATASSYNAPNPGAYTLELFNGTCYAISDPVVLTGGINALSNQQESKVNLRPNPGNETLFFDVDYAVTSRSKAEIRDMNNKLVRTLFLVQGQNAIDANDLNNDTYQLLLIEDTEVKYRQRFVIVK